MRLDEAHKLKLGDKVTTNYPTAKGRYEVVSKTTYSDKRGVVITIQTPFGDRFELNYRFIKSL